jgi:hypothetical protein
LDPYGWIALPAHSFELIGPTEDATLPGPCVAYDGRTMSMGLVTTFLDPALASLIAPFRIK